MRLIIAYSVSIVALIYYHLTPPGPFDYVIGTIGICAWAAWFWEILRDA